MKELRVFQRRLITKKGEFFSSKLSIKTKVSILSTSEVDSKISSNLYPFTTDITQLNDSTVRGHGKPNLHELSDEV